MTQTNQDSEEIIDQEKDSIEIPKVSIPLQKVSKFWHQGPSKFWQAVSGFNNPIQKGRPGRAAARGR